jgi:hypothetical protein
MGIEELSDQQLNALEVNYRTRNRTEGGKYSLADVLLEKRRRLPSPFGPREVAAKILELSANSSDGLITYGDLWNALKPGQPWTGHASLTILSNSLSRTIEYCVKNRMPVFTVLVVRGAQRKLSHEAIERIYSECKELGIDVGPDPAVFVKRELERSRMIRPDELAEQMI